MLSKAPDAGEVPTIGQGDLYGPALRLQRVGKTPKSKLARKVVRGRKMGSGCRSGGEGVGSSSLPCCGHRGLGVVADGGAGVERVGWSRVAFE
jgi:hypothetical protein